MEEEEIGEEHGGERREKPSVGEGGGPALTDGECPEEEAGVKADVVVGEKEGGGFTEETVFRELSSANKGTGEDTEVILNCEEQEGAWTEEEGKGEAGEAECCLGLGLKAERALLRSVSGP